MTETTHAAGTRVQDWIPHRGAMRLLDRVIDVGPEHAIAEVDVPFDGLFVRDGHVPAWIGIEYMAQTVSAWAGARARLAGRAPRLGLLLGTRRYEAGRGAFPSGSLLRIEARCEFFADNGLGMFDCRIDLDGVQAAQGKLSVLDPEDPAILFGSRRA